MTITLELPPEIEARLVAEAQLKGVPLGEIVKEYLVNRRPEEQGPKQLSAGEVDKGFEEAADLIPAGTPSLSDEAISRESIYTREDDWNR